jgi:hypothetical protein
MIDPRTRSETKTPIRVKPLIHTFIPSKGLTGPRSSEHKEIPVTLRDCDDQTMAATFRTPGRRGEPARTESPSMIPRAQPGTPTTVSFNDTTSTISNTTDSRKRQTKKDEVSSPSLSRIVTDSRQSVANSKVNWEKRDLYRHDHPDKKDMRPAQSWLSDRVNRLRSFPRRLLPKQVKLWLQREKIVFLSLMTSND